MESSALIGLQSSLDNPCHRKRVRRVGDCRSAFTLMELMLVLALILAIGAVAVPKFTDLFARQRLHASAERIRLEFDRARLLAMQTGQAQLFECIVGEDKYSVRPLTQDADAINSGEGATLVTQAGVSPPQPITVASWRLTIPLCRAKSERWKIA